MALLSHRKTDGGMMTVSRLEALFRATPNVSQPFDRVALVKWLAIILVIPVMSAKSLQKRSNTIVDAFRI